MAKMFLSNENYLSQRTNNAQITQLSPYFADTMHTLFKKKKSMKQDINSLENSVYPAQLASSEAS